MRQLSGQGNCGVMNLEQKAKGGERHLWTA